jgi:hypothetical protein
MIKKIAAIGMLAIVFLGCQSQGQITGKSASSEQTSPKKAEDDLKPYREVITSAAKSDEGLFTTHQVGDKVYYEIPFGLLDKDMLLVSRIAKVPAGFGGGYVNAGSKANEQVIRWTKRGKNVDIRIISFENESDENSPIYQSVAANNFFPILYSTKIAAYNPDSTAVVVEVNSLYEMT